MRSRLISVFAAFTVMVVAPAALFGQKENPEPSLVVRQKIDMAATNLSRNLSRAKSVDEKMTLIEKTLRSMNESRKKNPRQLAEDEIYMDNLAGALQNILNIHDFNIESCDQYQKQLNHLFDGKADGGKAHDPALKKSLDVLRSLCNK